VTRVLYAAFDVIPSPKGASVHVMEFVRALCAAGCEVHLLVPNDGTQRAEETWCGARVRRIEAGREGTYLDQALAFAAAVSRVGRSERFDVVHYRSIWGGLELAQARRELGYRALFEVNGLPSIELPYHYPGLAGAPLLDKLRERELATLALSDAIVTPSNVTRDYLESIGAERGRVTVVRNGVDLARFVATPLPEPGERAPVILYVGTFAEWQGLDDLLSAVALLVPRGPLLVRIVGRARKRQRRHLEKRIAKLGLDGVATVEPPLPHDDVPALIRGADICVAPLELGERNVTQGCCPLKILEYLASGRPVVATNLPVVRELVREEAEALLFTPGKPADLARQLGRLLGDRGLAARIAGAGAARAARDFGWDASGRGLVAVYEGLLGSALRPDAMRA
jgi:glycosyltransferase involved in cell wall biosynthesis